MSESEELIALQLGDALQICKERCIPVTKVHDDCYIVRGNYWTAKDFVHRAVHGLFYPLRSPRIT